MLIKRGRFIEYGVFGKETSADWTIISNAKGERKRDGIHVRTCICIMYVAEIPVKGLYIISMFHC